MKKEAPATKEKKRKAPDFTGVPGELISTANLSGLTFASGRKSKGSPYDPLLDQLDKAPKDSALRFGDPRVRVSLLARARKKGIVLAFAEADGALFVKISGHADDALRDARDGKILTILLRDGPMGYIRLTSKLRETGDELVDAPITVSHLR